MHPQFYGLNDWARDVFSQAVRVVEKGERTYPDGRVKPFERVVHLPVYDATAIGPLRDNTDTEFQKLYRYEGPDGVVYEEFVQSVLWYGGPCYFIALKKDGEEVPESLWRKEEMRVG